MKPFKQFISEAVTEGALMEEIIVASWNNKKPPKSSKIDSNAGKKIVSFLKKQGVSGKEAYKLPEGIDVTKTWSNFWYPNKVPAKTKTPKTDIVIGNYTISLKTGPAQLMSGGKNESKATFYAAALKTPSVQTDKLAEQIYNKLNQISELSSTKSGTVEQSLKSGRDLVLKKANKINHEVKEMLRDLFNKNEDFKYNFIYEAMSGDTKFGSTTAKASWILSTDFNGENNKLIKTNNKSFIKKISEVTIIECRFKSKSEKLAGEKTGKYNYWSVVGLVTKKLQEEFEMYDKIFLTENIIIGIYEKLKKFIKNLFEKVLELLKGGIERIIDFFDLDPDVNFNNQINFSEL